MRTEIVTDDFSHSSTDLFSEISILIPGYAVEDLPTDLPEEEAASLLNAFACAWHPSLLSVSNSIPVARQAESLLGYPGRRIILVPTPSESWMPHEWRTSLRSQDHIVIDGCSERAQWIAAIQAAFPSADSSQSAPSAEIVGHFLALGTALLQIQLLSRKRHHYVDPDNLLLARESRAAAAAAIEGDDSAAQRHLMKCFEHLREVRERFHPMNCFLLDFCIPGETDTSQFLDQFRHGAPVVNLFLTGRDLLRWANADPVAGTRLSDLVDAGTVCILTGHDWETRVALGSMAATVADLRRGLQRVQEMTGHRPRHWARRRFGLTAAMPALLSHFGFESAQHLALDDGLYPDRERSQFEWQGPDGTTIAAASRIPLAIDSASGFLRFADRFNESMQDDHTAALFLARLPHLRTPWLRDLQTAAEYAPVLGAFVSIDTLCHESSGSRLAESHRAADYLSPFLIQSSVLKTEAPISGPATLRAVWQQLEAIRTLAAIAAIARADLTLPDGRGHSQFLDETESSLADLEISHLEVARTPQISFSSQASTAARLTDQLSEMGQRLAESIARKIPSTPAELRGILVINAAPFGRTGQVAWPVDWHAPKKSEHIEHIQKDLANRRMLVRLPPGGYLWITECQTTADAHPETKAAKGEPPLAELLTLRNRHFEVTLSDRTGGIQAVHYYGQRKNRISQQVGFRYERDQTVPDDGSGVVHKTSYAVVELSSHRILESGPVFASIETVSELRSPVDGKRLARVTQTTSINRSEARIQISVSISELESPVRGNPWLTYFGCRFAWENDAAVISRGVLDQTAGIGPDRFESPDYVEVIDDDSRAAILTHGRCFHRRSGPRMLDSLLIVEGEPARSFQLTLEFDQRHPLRTAVDVMTPVICHQTNGLAPKAVSGWLLGLSARNASLVRADYLPPGEGQSAELELLIVETSGQSTACTIRSARQPSAAFLVNAARTQKVALEINEQGVTVPLLPYQIRGLLLVF